MLRDVVETDLPIFYQQQLDAESIRMAASPSRGEWAVFLEHWTTKVLGNPANGKQTIVWNDQVAGYVASWSQEDRRLIAYWIGREYWGRGIATAALTEYLHQERARPLHAFVAVHNVGSMRVLEKCGFVRVSDGADAHGEVGEFLYRID